MDGAQFDRITAELARRVGRRRFVGIVGPGWLAAVIGFAAPTDEADARGKTRGRRGGSGLDRNDGRDRKDERDDGRSGNNGPDDRPVSLARKKKKCKGGKKRCAGRCVDLETSPANCGACGNACGSGQSCQGGQCVAGCGPGKILCNGVCVASVGDHPCCSQADCGGPIDSSNQIACDLDQHQCRCVNTNHGICERTPDKRGLCNTCCVGGNPATCLGQTGCNGFNFCTCPAGRAKCPGGDNRCRQNPIPAIGESTLCGFNCTDCTQGGTKPYVCCVGGDCANASGYNPGEGGSLGTFCGGCTQCDDDKVCCKERPDTGPSCKTPVQNGVCPLLSGGG